MKKVLNVLLMFVIAMICTLGTTTSVEARPVDTGYNQFQLMDAISPMWIDADGILWEFYITDSFPADGEDFASIYAFDTNTTSILSTQSNPYYDAYTSSIDFRKGIATFKSSRIDLTVTFAKAEGTYTISGSRKNGNISYTYTGPAYIKGSITIGSTTYPIEGDVNGNNSITLIESHSIVK